MQSISTKYIPASSTRGARIQASTPSGEKVVIPYNYEDEKAGHIEAAQKLKTKLKWSGRMVGGSTKDGYVFVSDDGKLRINPVRPLRSKVKAKPVRKNPVKSAMTSRPKKARAINKAKPTFTIQVKEPHGWVTVGIEKTESAARTAAQAVSDALNNTKYVRVTV